MKSPAGFYERGFIYLDCVAAKFLGIEALAGFICVPFLPAKALAPLTIEHFE